MYEETGLLGPNSMDDVESNDYFKTMSNDLDSGLPNANMESSDAIGHSSFGENVVLPVDEFSYKCNLKQVNMVGGTDVVSSVAEAEFQQQMAYDIENCYNDVENNSLLHEGIHEVNHALSYEQTNWVASSDYDVNDMCYGHENENQQEHQLQQVEMLQNGHGKYSSSALLDGPYPSAPDLLNLLHLSRSPSSASFLPNSTISFSNGSSQSTSNFRTSVGLMDAASSSGILYDPLLHLNLPPQPPIFKDLFQSLPHGLNLPVPMTSSLFATMDEMEHGRGMFHDVDGQILDDGVLEFTADLPRMVKGRNGKLKPFATERDRRDNLNNKYTTLKSLIPSPRKTDRASIVEDAIEYIKELTRSINDLKVQVEKKRCIEERIKRLKTEDASPDLNNSDVNSSGELNGPLRSSWVQRKSKDTEVDVRIIDDELTVKLSQRKKFNCLLPVSKILEEMQLDIQYVSGGHVGDFYSFLFNTKIGEASCVYAGGIANKLIEGVERRHAGLATTNDCF